MRRRLTWLSILGGMALMIVSYFFLAAPWGAGAAEDSNPRFSFAPALFVVGVVLLFGSAVVYELLPDRREQ
ncbi:MAG TPA: hypothetical protein VI854_06820 [Acidimicrobiia bacterium]|nr:hypothetical protein [Acidimicrobiia bacterium]